MSNKQDPFLEGVAENLRRLMQEHDLSSADLAELSGLPPRRLKRVLAGELEPKTIELMAMAKALGVRPGVLIDNLSLDENGEGGTRGRRRG